jgi:hypothetical protein
MDIYKANTTFPRGHHSTITAIDLPHWLPTKTLEDMVQRYRAHVKREVVRALHPDPAGHIGHRRTGSMESDSAVSVGSEASGHNVMRVTSDNPVGEIST